MPTNDVILRQPTVPSQLVLPFHGVGSSARDLAPLGAALEPHLPGAAIVSVQAPEDSGPGWQWFSLQGVGAANRPARVAGAMARFTLASVRTHLMHGDADGIMPVQGAIDALAQLQGLGAMARATDPSPCTSSISAGRALPGPLPPQSANIA